MKTCVKCRILKGLDEFYPSKRQPDGRWYYCKECTRALANAYSKKHMAAKIAQAKEWYRANKDRKRAYDAQRRLQKRELYRAASKRFRENNPGRKNADTQKRRAKLAQRQPLWIKAAELTAFYEAAARVTRCLGIQHCVDHIIPLRGQRVSGLHVPGNLRVIPEPLNLLKSNHFSITPDGVRA